MNDHADRSSPIDPSGSSAATPSTLPEGVVGTPSVEPRARWRAGAVHLFTALGVVCALLATEAVLAERWELAFTWLGVALIIDGVDGWFARRYDVMGTLPRFSGERLDLVVDYVTYVFVPVLALLQAELLAEVPGRVLAALVLVSSLFHFCDTESKAEDNSFVGFPAIWNIVAFYAFALGLGPWATSALVLLCVVLTFVPMHWVHPLRVVDHIWITALAAVVWCGAASVLLLLGLTAEGMMAAVARVVLVTLALAGVLQSVLGWWWERR
jgi:phosphatidylcholine synthase